LTTNKPKCLILKFLIVLYLYQSISEVASIFIQQKLRKVVPQKEWAKLGIARYKLG
jgi:hypothetical protein